MVGLIVDGLIVGLLVAVLGLGATVHLRLRRLRGPDGELRAMIGALDGAVSRAEAALAELRRGAIEIGAGIGEERERAARAADDLRLLTARAEREADRLADLIGQVRKLGGHARAVPAVPEAGSTTGPATGPRDRRDLERALRSLR